MWVKSFCIRCVFPLILLLTHQHSAAHPLRLSLSQIEYSSEKKLLSVSLRLFVMDVNEAIVFDPESTELNLGLPTESENAEVLLLQYLNQYFYIKVNGQIQPLNIESKKRHGEGINTALGLVFEFRNLQALTSLEVKNTVFTDLFFDQSNIVYLHIDGDSDSFMLNKDTPIHHLEF
ncbi:MAG: DUF6702 family protein [Paraglaciecola sp.]|uniref:DUF6702 family protein n=1 Tax=Paraglaciecola sp. TaxID=1920173 RepID=UPI003264A821